MAYRTHDGSLANVLCLASEQQAIIPNQAVEAFLKRIHSDLKKHIIIDDDMWQAYYNQYKQAIDQGLGTTGFGTPNWKLKQELKYNAATFAAFKNHAEVKEVQALLIDGDKVRKWEDFRDKALAKTGKYRKRWLQTEYNHAVQSCRMAQKWQDAVANSDLYPNLEYITVNDDRVRDSHQGLHGAIYPINDPFWNTYFPPNGWGCRCTVRPTDKPPKKEKSRPDMPAMFRNNPGRSGEVFKALGSYGDTDKKKEINAWVQNKMKFNIKRQHKTVDDVNATLQDFQKAYPETFARGFKALKAEQNRNNNGSTNMNGTIWLKQDRINRVMDALNNIKKGKPTTFEQEDALSTLWHEICHNSNKLGFKKIGAAQTKYMELANEFVARKTLPVFFEQLGGKINNTSLTETRKSTGYNDWVENYQKAIRHFKADETKVLTDVQQYLFNESYATQKNGLSEALMNNAKVDVKKKEANTFIQKCLKSEYLFDYWYKYERK